MSLLRFERLLDWLSNCLFHFISFTSIQQLRVTAWSRAGRLLTRGSVMLRLRHWTRRFCTGARLQVESPWGASSSIKAAQPSEFRRCFLLISKSCTNQWMGSNDRGERDQIVADLDLIGVVAMAPVQNPGKLKALVTTHHLQRHSSAFIYSTAETEWTSQMTTIHVERTAKDVKGRRFFPDKEKETKWKLRYQQPHVHGRVTAKDGGRTQAHDKQPSSQPTRKHS